MQPSGGEQQLDVLAMLDGRRVARHIAWLLIAAAGLAVAWALLTEAPLRAVLIAAAYAVAAVAVGVWQHVSPARDPHRLLTGAICGGTALVLLGSALAPSRQGPFLLFLIWFVPWAFVAWSRARAIAFVISVALVCAALLALEPSGNFLSEQAPVLLVGLGGLVAIGVVVSDVLAVATRRIEVERERREEAGRDALTGLAGREPFAERLRTALAHEDGAAVLVVDVDDFVLVNETLGPAAGDALLRGVAERLLDCAGEAATVARFGGDEFALFDPTVSRDVLAIDLAKRVKAALKAPFELAGSRHHVTASIGIAVCRRGDDPRGAIRNAHLAQRRAREHGRGRYEVFDDGLRLRLEQRRAVEQELCRALEQREFRLVYQPVVELETGRVRGAEALIRWQHPDRGLVSPAEFIEVAEATDLIVPIGDWTLRESLRQLKAWERGLPGLGDFRLSVNVSGRQLADGRFVALLRSLLAKYEIDPARVTCELTETALTDESPQVEAAVGEIKALGVRLALDDFGTGYASLRYLRRFDFDALKLDRSFVGGLGSDEDDTALVAAAVTLGGALNMEVVAEGVEREDQAERLRSLGCELAQGFLFARPMEAGDVRKLIVDGLAGGEVAQPTGWDHDAHPGSGAGLALQLEVPTQGIDALPR